MYRARKYKRNVLIPPGHPTILLKSNEFNMAAVQVKKCIAPWKCRMHRHFKNWNDMKHEPRKFWLAKTIVLFMQNYSNTRLATVNHRRQIFLRGRVGRKGSLHTGQCISNPMDISVFCRKRNASHLSISIPVVVFLTDVKLLVIFNEGHLAWTSLLHVSSEK